VLAVAHFSSSPGIMICLPSRAVALGVPGALCIGPCLARVKKKKTSCRGTRLRATCTSTRILSHARFLAKTDATVPHANSNVHEREDVRGTRTKVGDDLQRRGPRGTYALLTIYATAMRPACDLRGRLISYVRRRE